MADEQTPQDVEATPAPAPEAAAAPAAPAEPQEVLPPKERRRRARAAKASRSKARPARTPEERQAERRTERTRKAQERRAGRTKAKAKAKATGGPGSEPTAPRQHVEGTQKVRQGIVVSDKADKTITVRIDAARRHRRYEKIVRTSQTFHAHDERNDAHTGDTVTIRESRPLSRTKRWRLVDVIERAR